MRILIIIFVVIIVATLTYISVPSESKKGLLGDISFWRQGDTDEEENDDDDDDESVNAKQQLVDGNLVVRIPLETQKLAGFKTVLAENTDVQSEDRAFATVIDINELLQLRSEYRNTEAQRRIKSTTFKNSSKSLEQLKVLHKEATNISARELQNARSQWEQDRAELNAVDIKLVNIREKINQKWNTELMELALKENSASFDRLVAREDFLVLMTLKANQQLSEESAFVFVNRNDDRLQARKAYFISAAPFSDPSLQGETYFFRTNADKIRIGMRLYVWLPETGFSGEGVNIPEQAVVWYAGKPWAYVQVDDELFSRRSLLEPIETDNGWLVKENFNTGEKIVISGAQTLLSEEFKWAIPDEDDD